MPRISNTVPPEMFDAMRERAEAADLARADGNPDYDPPILPDVDFEIIRQGGYPQPQWPDDVILPDNKDPMEQEAPVDGTPQQPLPPPLPDHIPRPEASPEATPEPEVIETSQADELDGELVAQTTLADKAELAAGKIDALFGEKAVSPEAEAAASSISGTFRDMAHSASEIASKAQAAIEAVNGDGVVETQADDVYEAETAPVEADDDSDPYDSDV